MTFSFFFKLKNTGTFLQFVHKIGSFTSNSNNVDDWPRMDLKIIRKKKEFRSSDEEISLSYESQLEEGLC